jgi:hypothetical protein
VNGKLGPNSAPGGGARVSMICFKSCFALCACSFGLLVTSTAKADEPLSNPRRLELVRPFSRASTLPFGLRLPKILSFGPSSAPALAPRVPSHALRQMECRSYCAEGALSDRTRATTSAILAGVGGLALVTGVVLTVSKPRQSEQFGLAPLFRLKLSGQRAVASADWRF